MTLSTNRAGGRDIDMTTLAERFWSRVDKQGNCWLWTGARDSNGYGKFWVAPCLKMATHVAWLLEIGSWPVNCMCHHCDNPSCVRASHLFDATRKENTQDAMRKGRMVNPMRGRKHTQASRELIAAALRGRKHTRASRKRIKAGMERARRAGKHVGRPLGRKQRSSQQNKLDKRLDF